MNAKQKKALLLKARAEIRAAFFDAIKDARDGVDFGALERAFSAGDVEAAIKALRISRASFEPMAAAIESTFTEAGRTTASTALNALRGPDGQRVSIRFDVRDPNTEKLVREYSYNKVVGITDDMTTGLRNSMERMLRDGVGPRSIAVEIAGPINKATGKRENGLIGLTKRQMEQVLDAKAELKSGDPKALRNYLSRKLRDRRFDKFVNDAINNDKPIPADIINKAINQLENRALLNRAETIARTESLRALHSGQRSAYQQAIDSGAVTPDEIERVWSSSGDGRTRDTHEEMDGQTVGWEEPYTSPSGAKILYPGDPSAPAEEVINCRCYENVRINYLRRITNR